MRIAALLLLLVSPAFGKGLAGLTLPKGVTAEWIIKPSRAGRGDKVSFAVDPKGRIWFTANDIAFAPQKNVLFRADQPVDQLLWLGGQQLARSAGALGYFETIKDPPTGMARAHFKPLTDIPLKAWRMAPAGENDICIAGYNPRKDVSQIALLGPGARGKGIKIIHTTEAQISDVARIGKHTYFAAGGAIWKIIAPGQPARIVYARKKNAVRRIVAAPGGGLFFATKDTVGYAGKNAQFEFFRCKGCQIAVAGESLYILRGKVSKGVLRLNGARAFNRLKL